MIIIKEKLKLFHFALTMTLLPRKLVRQIFWFPKYTLYLHQELLKLLKIKIIRKIIVGNANYW